MGKVRVGIGALLLLLLLWPLLAWRPIVTPSVDPVGPVDAVYVLGPAENRMPAALTMVEGGASPLLLATISVDPVTGTGVSTGLLRIGHRGLPGRVRQS